jgi:hypothetical protein
MQSTSELAHEVATGNVVPFAQNGAASGSDEGAVVANAVTMTVAFAKDVAIVDATTFERAGELRVSLSALLKRVKAYWDPVVKKAYDLHKDLTTKRKRHLDAVQAEIDRLDRGLGAFRDAEELAKRERDRQASFDAQEQEVDRLTGEAALLQAQGQPELAAAVLEQARTVPAPAVSLPSELPKVDGLSFTEGKWRYRVFNEALVPRRYLSVDPKKVDVEVAQMKGATKIPGIEVYQEASGVRSRT